MTVVFSAAPAAAALNGLPVALTIAVAATALAAIGMVVVMLRRRTRLTGLWVALGVASAATVVVGALLVGGSLTRPPAAAADEDRAPRGSAQQPIEAKLTGLQLPTLALED